MDKQGRILIKPLATVAFCLITAALWIAARTPSVRGYEISIYAAYPWYFWLFLITSVAIGIYILVQQAFAAKSSKWWLAGFAIVLLVNSIVLLFPIFRGYFFNDVSDGLYHLGMIRDIELTGHVGDYNFYPVSHVLAIGMSSVSGLDFKTVVMILPTLFYLLYIAGVYLLARAIGRSRGEVLLIATFGTVLLLAFYNSTFTPFTLSFAIIPWVMFLYHRSVTPAANTVGNRIVLVIMLLLIPFFHIFSALALVFAFIVFKITVLIHRRLTKQEDPYAHKATPSISLAPALITLILCFVWFSGFTAFSKNILETYNWFIHGVGETPVAGMGESLERSGWTMSQVLWHAVKAGGHHLLYFLLSLVAISVVLKKIFSWRNSLRREEIFYSLILVMFGLGYLLTLTTALPTGGEPRFPAWFLMAATVLCGMVLHQMISPWLRRENPTRRKAPGKRIAPYLLTAIIIACATIGIFTVHFSPIVKVANHQVTKASQVGMEWLLEYKDAEEPVTYSDEYIPRVPLYRVGSGSQEPEVGTVPLYAPPHFGYDLWDSLAYSFDSDGYLVIGERTRAIYKELWPERGSFTVGDFVKLSSDPAVAKLYNNGGMETWQVSVGAEQQATG